jgi:hypothetical protein
MVSNQSSTSEQGASFEKGAPRCSGVRHKTKLRSQTKRVVGPIKAYILASFDRLRSIALNGSYSLARTAKFAFSSSHESSVMRAVQVARKKLMKGISVSSG